MTKSGMMGVWKEKQKQDERLQKLAERKKAASTQNSVAAESPDGTSPKEKPEV